MTKPAGAIAAFGNSVPNLWKLAKKDYATPLAANHRLVLLIHETSGALSPATRRQLCNLTGYIDIDTILARGAYLTWTNSSSVLTYLLLPTPLARPPRPRRLRAAQVYQIPPPHCPILRSLNPERPSERNISAVAVSCHPLP